MEPLIRNVEGVFKRAGIAARLISIDDKPPTCTMTYSVIEPGKTSVHHIHPWEHEVYILEGSGVLVQDGKEYPIREGDGIFIPPNVDHYTLNNRTSGNIRRLEVNPLIASQSTAGRNQGGQGTGQPPVIRNYRQLDIKVGHVLLQGKDGAPNYVLLYNGPLDPGAMTHPEANGHVHPWEHTVFILEGSGTIVIEGKNYNVTAGDAILVPPNAWHQWKNETKAPMLRVTFNPIAYERAKQSGSH
jgi:quercetin dioxygenase-like cupin family protein